MNFLQKTLRKNKVFVIIATIYFFTSVAFIFTSGWETCEAKTGKCTISIADYHAHDAFWHIAIAETSFRSFPPLHPDFAGTRLTNYNYLFDWFLHLLNQLFGINPAHGYFHVFPVLTATLYILAVFFAIKSVKMSSHSQIATAFFLFLGNSFAFIMTLFSSGTLVGSSVRGFPLVLSLQPTIMFYNNQFALSLVFILLAIAIVHRSNSLSLKNTLIIGILIATTTALKVYGGAALLLYVIFYYASITVIHKKKILNTGINVFTIFTFFLFTVFLIGGSGKGVFTYDPLALIRSLLDDPSHLFNNNIALARVTLESSGKFSPRLLAIYVAAATSFFLINFGARAIGIHYTLKVFAKKNFNPHLISVLISTIILSVIPLVMLQKGDWWNTIQFLYYAIFLSSFIAGESIGSLKGVKKLVVYTVVIVSVLIPTIDQWRYMIYKNDVLITHDFIQATSTLRTLPYGSVSTLGKIAGDSRIPAFTGFPLTIGNIPILRNTLVDYESKEKEFLKYGYDRSADYVFVDKTISTDWKAKMSSRVKVFENDQYVIFAYKTYMQGQQ